VGVDKRNHPQRVQDNGQDCSYTAASFAARVADTATEHPPSQVRSPDASVTDSTNAIDLV
jgi:hypothetical protein